MKKKKVIFWLEMFDKGGLEKVTLDLVNNLNPEKYDITVMQKFKGGYCRSQLKPHIKKKCCFPLFANGVARIFKILPPKVLYKIFIRDKYDIEIAVGDGGPSRIIGASNNTESRKISWIHMDVQKEGWILPEFETEEGKYKFYEPFEKIICVSQDCKDRFVEKFGFKNKCIVKYNPIPEEHIKTKSLEKIDIHMPKDIIKIISVGSLLPVKGYDRLIKVHHRLIKEGYKHKLYIVGEGKMRNKLEEYININNLKESVELLGFKENPYKYMKNSDLFICSSTSEAFSTVQAEATILGLPIVTTKCSGTGDLLGNSEYGLVVDNSENGIYEGLRRIMTDKELLKYYKKQSIKRGEMFNFKINIKEWEKLLDNE